MSWVAAAIPAVSTLAGALLNRGSESSAAGATQAMMDLSRQEAELARRQAQIDLPYRQNLLQGLTNYASQKPTTYLPTAPGSVNPYGNVQTVDPTLGNLLQQKYAAMVPTVSPYTAQPPNQPGLSFPGPAPAWPEPTPIPPGSGYGLPAEPTPIAAPTPAPTPTPTPTPIPVSVNDPTGEAAEKARRRAIVERLVGNIDAQGNYTAASAAAAGTPIQVDPQALYRSLGPDSGSVNSPFPNDPAGHLATQAQPWYPQAAPPAEPVTYDPRYGGVTSGPPAQPVTYDPRYGVPPAQPLNGGSSNLTAGNLAEAITGAVGGATSGAADRMRDVAAQTAAVIRAAREWYDPGQSGLVDIRGVANDAGASVRGAMDDMRNRAGNVASQVRGSVNPEVSYDPREGGDTSTPIDAQIGELGSGLGGVINSARDQMAAAAQDAVIAARQKILDQKRQALAGLPEEQRTSIVLLADTMGVSPEDLAMQLVKGEVDWNKLTAGFNRDATTKRWTPGEDAGAADMENAWTASLPPAATAFSPRYGGVTDTPTPTPISYNERYGGEGVAPWSPQAIDQENPPTYAHGLDRDQMLALPILADVMRMTPERLADVLRAGVYDWQTLLYNYRDNPKVKALGLGSGVTHEA